MSESGIVKCECSLGHGPDETTHSRDETTFMFAVSFQRICFGHHFKAEIKKHILAVFCLKFKNIFHSDLCNNYVICIFFLIYILSLALCPTSSKCFSKCSKLSLKV